MVKLNSEGDGAFPAGYELLKPWIGHVQVKDVKRLPDGTSTSVRFGMGDVDYRGQPVHGNPLAHRQYDTERCRAPAARP
ncbi:MAG TPA: hypothetical protein VE844_13360, partial [Gammaproteobacteria bacterium]|nr:hypothetical protein [Gammaproteobacteria bacterium]